MNTINLVRNTFSCLYTGCNEILTRKLFTLISHRRNNLTEREISRVSFCITKPVRCDTMFTIREIKSNLERHANASTNTSCGGGIVNNGIAKFEGDTSDVGAVQGCV